MINARTPAVWLLLLFSVSPQPARSELNEANALAPIGHTIFCGRYPAECKLTHAKKSLPKSSMGRYRYLVAVNREVNDSIAPFRDPDPIDRNWYISPKKGNCNDYAVTKRHKLLLAGWPSSTLRLAEVTIIATGEHHLILIVKGGKGSWVLDNLKPEVSSLEDTRNDYVWARVESAKNPRFWTRSFHDLI